VKALELGNFYFNLLFGIFDCLIIASKVPIGIGFDLPCNGTGTITPEEFLKIT